MNDVFDCLNGIVGQSVRQVHRFHYLFDGQLDTSCGSLEILLKDGQVAHFSGKGDGQSLDVQWESWQDPFAGDQESINREFVGTHGKWTKVDAADDPVLGRCVGRVITRLDVVRVDGAASGGLRFTVGDHVFCFVVAGDEDFVLAADDPRLLEWRVIDDEDARSYGV